MIISLGFVRDRHRLAGPWQRQWDLRPGDPLKFAILHGRDFFRRATNPAEKIWISSSNVLGIRGINVASTPLAAFGGKARHARCRPTDIVSTMFPPPSGCAEVINAKGGPGRLGPLISF